MSEQQLLLLQRELKPPSSSAPQLEHLKVAVALARNTSLAPTTLCKEAGFKSSGTRKTIMGLRDRIIEKDLLNIVEVPALLLPQCDAATTARERKAELQRQRRHGEEATLQSVLSSLITRLEYTAAREQRQKERHRASELTWCCIGGCVSADDCARAAFRHQCMPTDDAIREHLRARWREQQEDLVALGDFRGPSGHCFVRRDEQVRCWGEQEATLLEEHGDLCFDDELDEVKRDFIATWDGKTPPGAWLSHGNMKGLQDEYCGMPKPNRGGDCFGYSDIYPVGVLECARRGCDGCCYCRGQPSPPAQYVNVVTYDTLSLPRSTWMNVDELRELVWKQVADDDQSRSMLSEPVPTYLLERQPTISSIGGVMQVSGAVRGLVDAIELASWSEELQGSMLLQILSSDSVVCAPNAEEAAVCSEQQEHRRTLLRERTAADKERKQLDACIRHEAQRGCGHRINWEWDPSRSNLSPALRRGDLVYHAPPADRSTEPGVGVVTDICYAHGGISDGAGSQGGLRSGYVKVLFWQFGKRCFGCSQEVWESDFTLLPPCCGRGAGCPHLLLSQTVDQHTYPNGDPLRLKDLQAIPDAFQATLDSMPCSRKDRQSLEDSYAALLDPLGERRQQRKTEEHSAEQERLAKRQRLSSSDRNSDSMSSDGVESECADSQSDSLDPAVYSDGLSEFDSSDGEPECEPEWLL